MTEALASSAETAVRGPSSESPHRPLYAGTFPTLTSAQIASRSVRLEPHLATQLDPNNLRTFASLHGWEWFEHFLNMSSERQSQLFCEVLALANTKQRTIEAFERIRRHDFCPPTMKWAAWLNWSVPLAAGSVLSSPGLVAIMLDWLPKEVEGTIVEVGSGSGYHAALTASLLSRPVEAFERLKSVAVTSQRTLQARYPFLDVKVVCSAAPLRVAPATQIVYETAVPLRETDRFAANPNRSLAWIGPRPLRESEFYDYTPHSRLRTTYLEYQKYLGQGRFSQCVLAGRTKAASETWMETSRLYGVRFVGQRPGVEAGTEASSNRGLEALRVEYNEWQVSNGRD